MLDVQLTQEAEDKVTFALSLSVLLTLYAQKLSIFSLELNVLNLLMLLQLLVSLEISH
jgi:hypothetical protein